MNLRAPFEDLLDATFPARCPGCGRTGAVVCGSCAQTLTPPPISPPPHPIEWWTSCFAYSGVARELVARAKYRNGRRFLAVIAHDLAARVASAPAPIDIVTWAPASAARVRSQGVDHGEVLARGVARLAGLRTAPCLARTPGPAQTGLDAHARRVGPPLRARTNVTGATVLVVDDVATTGGTLSAAARVLREECGAAAVFAATIARTPAPGALREAATYTPNTSTLMRASRK